MYILQKQKRFVIPRTELTYPAHTLKMNEKAAQAPVDHVMPDFEDACPYEFKGDASRKVLVEALNTCLETLCDLVSPTYHPLVKKCKDVSAAAVLISSAWSWSPYSPSTRGVLPKVSVPTMSDPAS